MIVASSRPDLVIHRRGDPRLHEAGEGLQPLGQFLDPVRSSQRFSLQQCGIGDERSGQGRTSGCESHHPLPSIVSVDCLDDQAAILQSAKSMGHGGLGTERRDGQVGDAQVPKILQYREQAPLGSGYASPSEHRVERRRQGLVGLAEQVGEVPAQKVRYRSGRAVRHRMQNRFIRMHRQPTLPSIETLT